MKKNIFKDSIQKVVDKVDGKIVDISSMILMIIDLILVMKLFISTLDINNFITNFEYSFTYFLFSTFYNLIWNILL